MKFTLEDRLMCREIGANTASRYSQVKGIYGSRSFVEDLDIINELTGHSGCVNALSWSRSGRLLASGSDDKIINIYSYLPEHSANEFELATQIDTGHSRNIFSVKFMPHSNDRTIVSAAGDAQIRVFDIERSGVTHGSKLRLSQNQANCKVFRSHSGACKRIVTEASPFYFLSCSEDGDVRQWDIRQPESTYPRSASRYYTHRHGRSRDDAPPPLISYQEYNIDLMTISCSPSQPHYIALGGTALHCFLHDRRMLGRDILKEKGSMPSDLKSLEAATQCVRKFAPYGQPKMRRSDPKSITACKISDANPNELIASWNGDNIYSFNILRDDGDQDSRSHPGFSNGSSSGKAKDLDRKRKRKNASTSGLSQIGEIRGGSQPRTDSDGGEGSQRRQEMSLLFQMENGQSVEIPIPSRARPETRITTTRTEDESQGELVSGQVRHVRRVLFNNTEPHSATRRPEQQSSEPVAIRNRMDQVLAAGLQTLEKMDSLIAEWSYPLTESRAAIAFQQKLREDRAKTWRFVQACGTIARVSSRRTVQNSPRKVFEVFDIIKPSHRESSMTLERHEQFGYDFIKTVLLWLDSGVGAVLREFTHDPDDPGQSYRRRRPVSRDAGIDDIDTELIPYLQNLASEASVDDIDDESGQGHIFITELDAVNALARAMRIPFADLAGRVAERDCQGRILTHDRELAIKFWGYRVCRAILKNAAIDVNYSLVDTAFGESSRVDTEAEEVMTAVTGVVDDSLDSDQDSDDEDAYDSDDDGEDELVTDSDDEDDEDENAGFALGPSGGRPKMSAGKDVPCATHTSSYRGHCNVETTKDVNFFGLQDEYVVSGSDCGNLFIWDKKTTKLLNILEGDNEVVNVVQAHPYEPILAVSGIDSTVKIFGVDGRARKNACMGTGVGRADPSSFTSIGLRGRRQRAPERARSPPPQPDSAFDLPTDSSAGIESTPAIPAHLEDDDAKNVWYEDAGFITAKGGLRSRRRMQEEYQIVSRNDMDRRRGARQGGFITRGMLAMLAEHMRVQNGEDGEEVDDRALADPEGCAVM